MRRIFDFIVSNWYWFVISAVMCLCAGYLYTKIVPNRYYSSATIYIDEDYSRGSGSDVTDLRPLRVMRNSSTLENEIVILHSRSLMRKVVDSLHSNVHYYMWGKLRRVEQYGPKSPVRIEVDSMSSEFDMVIELVDARHFTTQIVSRNDKRLKYNFDNLPYGSVIKADSIARIKVLKGSNCESYMGEKVEIAVVSPQRSAINLASRLEISSSQRATGILRLSLIDRVPQKAADVLNVLIGYYNADAIEGKRLSAQKTWNFINERLEYVERELSNVDSAVESFKKNRQSIDIASESNIYLKSVSDLEMQLAQVSTQIELVEGIERLLADEESKSELLPANIGISDEGLNGSIGQYNRMVLDRRRLGSDEYAANPVVSDLDADILSMRSSLLRSAANLKGSLTAKRRSMERQIATLRSKVSDVPTIEKENVSIARNQAIKSTIYSFLLTKLEETGMKLAATYPIATVVDYALPSSSPVSPRLKLILLASLIIGLLIPTIVLIIIRQLQVKVSDVDEVESQVTVPIVGHVPTKPDRRSRDDRIVNETSSDVVSEAFKIVRTNMAFTLPAGGQVIMITSSISGEAKSFTSINLSLTLSISGARVLLVDMDLRKGDLADKLGINHASSGLANFLAGRSNDVMSLVRRGDLNGVDLLYVGALPPNPAELLMSPRLDEAFAVLRQHYDYIVVDTSPVGLVADTIIANRVADLTIYSIRIGFSFKQSIASVESLYTRGVLRNMTLLLSDVNAGRSYGYSNGYGYGYGSYGYGYGYGRKKEKKSSLWRKFVSSCSSNRRKKGRD